MVCGVVRSLTVSEVQGHVRYGSQLLACPYEICACFTAEAFSRSCFMSMPTACIVLCVGSFFSEFLLVQFFSTPDGLERPFLGHLPRFRRLTYTGRSLASSDVT